MGTTTIDTRHGTPAATRTPFRRAIARHPVSTYLALTFVISWGAAAIVLGPTSLPLSWERFERLGPRLYAAALAGPTLAALITTYLLDGRHGLRELTARLGQWRLGVGWYALALIPATLMAACSLAGSRLAGEPLPPIFHSDAWVATLALAALIALVFGLFEEIGWSGFAVPHMRARHSVFTTGLLIGLAWGAWHFPLFWAADSFTGARPLALLLLGLFGWLPAFRILMVWLQARSGRLAMPITMHVALVMFQVTLASGTTVGTMSLGKMLIPPAVTWSLVAILALATRGRIFQRQR